MLVIITNNPLIKESYGSSYTVDYEDISYDDILIKIRNAVHRGASILMHPLYGSVKPKETPYRSVLMEMREGPVGRLVEGHDIERKVVAYRLQGPV